MTAVELSVKDNDEDMIGTGSGADAGEFPVHHKQGHADARDERTETTASITVQATKSQMRSVSLVTRVRRRPGGLLGEEAQAELVHMFISAVAQVAGNTRPEYGHRHRAERR